MPDFITDLTGGGNLTIYLVIGGLIAMWVAFKAVKLVMKVVALSVAGALWLGTAPWNGAAIDTPPQVVDCVTAAVADAASGWQANVTKRITIEELSADAACAGDNGLASGSAVVRLRTFYDIPFETWDVSPAGAVTRLNVSTIPSPG